jgi:hypothetical protein
MEATDWSGLALTAIGALIGLVALAIEPWSGLWYFAIILAVVIVAGSLLGLWLRHSKRAADRNAFIPLCAVVALLFVMSVAIWGFWPSWKDDGKLANFHVVGKQVAWGREDPNLLFANIYVQNDAGDADVAVYASSILSPAKGDMKSIDSLRALFKQPLPDKGLHFKIRSKELKWFSVGGYEFSPASKEQYIKGEITFYFIALLMINERETVKTMEICGFVTGNAPNSIIECPLP